MDIPALQAVLQKLDVTNDTHWTADGQPRLDTVKMMAGNPGVTREQVEAAAPGYSRSNAGSYTMQPPAAAPQAGETGTAPVAAPVAPPAPADITNPESEGSDGAAPFSEVKSEQPALVDGIGSAGAEDDVASLETKLAEAIAHTQEIREALDHVNKLLKEAIAEEDRLRDLLKVDERTSNIQAIQDYLASQKRILEDRARRRAIIQESGVDLKGLTANLKSPIDAAMARRTGRGGSRPSIPLKR